MYFVATDKDGSEWIYSAIPIREELDWTIALDDFSRGEDLFELPKGSIRKLIGRELTWEDEPVKLEKEICIREDEFLGGGYNYETAFLRDLQECLTKHRAQINAYHIEDDKLVVDLTHLGGTLTIGPSDDIRIDDRWISNELKG